MSKYRYRFKDRRFVIYNGGGDVAVCEAKDKMVLRKMITAALMELGIEPAEPLARDVARKIIDGEKVYVRKPKQGSSGHSTTSSAADFQSADGSASLPARSTEQGKQYDEDLQTLLSCMFK